MATAASPPTKGRSYEMVLYVADTDGGTMDPAFEAHCIPIVFLATAWWEQWRSGDDLRQAFGDATETLMNAKGPIWRMVVGPMAGAIATAWRLGWTFPCPRTMRTDRGRILDMSLDSPAAIRKEVQESVRRWRLAKVL